MTDEKHEHNYVSPAMADVFTALGVIPDEVEHIYISWSNHTGRLSLDIEFKPEASSKVLVAVTQFPDKH